MKSLDEMTVEELKVVFGVSTKHNLEAPTSLVPDTSEIAAQPVSESLGEFPTSLVETVIASNTSNSMSTLLLNVMSAVAQFERQQIKERFKKRQREGIELAKKKGVYKGRKRKLSAVQAQDLIARVSSGESRSKVAREFGISRDTLYKYLKDYKAV